MADTLPSQDVFITKHNGFHVDENHNTTDQKTDFLYGKYETNKKGDTKSDNTMGIIEELVENIKIQKDDGLKPLPGTVKNFYYGTTIFITGGTGFLGKALLEKLLRSCDDIKCIYILMREKRGLTVKQRHKELLNNIVFDKIRNKWPERLDKIKPIEGDVAQPDLGMTVMDRKTLEEEVDIIFHSAATIRFVEPLSEALLLNTLGIKKMIELGHKVKHLKSFVHVSTAFTNVDKHTYIEEKMYPPVYDPDALLQCVSSLPQDLFDDLAPRIQGGHPNTYTLTKSLAEAIISKYAAGLPLCVIRPSIVTAAHSEPYPGWIDNLFGVTGILMEIYRGTVRSAVCVKEGIMDLMPVDMAVNACITVAWHHIKYNSAVPMVYNCISGQSNPLSWDELTKYTVEHGRESPSKYVMMYPNFAYTTNRLKNLLWEISTHYVPSIIFDILLRAQGKKPMMMKLARRFKMAIMTGEYFATHEFKYSIDNMNSLMRDLEETNEHVEFCCDVKKVDWYAYMHWYVLGIRKYILKDTMESMPMAKKKLQRLRWTHMLIQFMTGYYLFCFLFHRRWKLVQHIQLLIKSL